MNKVVFVCLGNICRSPMAEFIMKALDQDGSLHIESRATSSWEHGNPVHQGTQKILRKYGVSFDSSKGSQQIVSSDFEFFDLIVGMESQMLRISYKYLRVVMTIKLSSLDLVGFQTHGTQVILKKHTIW